MKTFFKNCTLILLVLLSSQVLIAAPKERADIDTRHKWKMTDIYSDWNAWEQDLQRLEGMMDDYSKLKGSLSGGPQNLLKAYTMR
ncbi:MAG: hypothetical protein HN708_10635, partial [Candidatus Marinimicrobia bacterium]|nr:hypothetical protein [Candidatus Neomarinimicrobiota bacterium]MBT7830712.1 hypothetical protein [Candidatus Neomarinimicrobiota bacterium]